MKNTIKYAAILGCLCFFLMIIPGAISIACGFPLLVASFGFALGVILCVKGKIASKIFGSDNYRSSALSWAVVILILTGFRAVTSIMETLVYIRMFGNVSPDGSYVLGQYAAVVTASLLYALAIFVVIIIRSKCRKSDNIQGAGR